MILPVIKPISLDVVKPRSIIAVDSPQWGTADQAQYIFVNVTLDDNSVHPFSASQYDPMSYGVDIYNNAINGDYGTIAAYDPSYVPFAKTENAKTIARGKASK